MPEFQSSPEACTVAAAIKNRRTFKVLADDSNASPQPVQDTARCDAIVAAAVQTAGWAPFHYDRNLDGLAEPWRVDWLSGATCRKIALQFFEWFDDVKPSNKIPAMLNGCGSLVLVSWLPQFSTGQSETPLAKQRQIDEEHLAATAAYTQNLLLLLTAEGLGSYWSSGGQFRAATMQQKLGLDNQQRLLAAVFVDYNPDDSSKQRLPGKLQASRDDSCRWFAEVKL